MTAPPIPPTNTLNLTADNSIVAVYSDGLAVSSGSLPNANNPGAVDTVVLPNITTFIAVEANDAGDGEFGILASDSLGFILTNTSWKCSGVSAPGWNAPGFDDSFWPYAVEAPGNCFDLPEIAASATWIWSSPYYSTVYCRLNICKIVLFNIQEETRPPEVFFPL